MFSSPLYWIADASLVGDRPLVELAESAIGAGLRVLQYRDKSRSQRDQYPIALALADLAKRSGATFIVNDDIDLALVVQAHGVHLGQGDFPVTEARRILGRTMIIGCSAHTLDQAKAAEADGADYLGVGPIYESTTKMARPPLGCDHLREICDGVRIPVYAIGGITVERCGDVLAAGARGVAVASGLLVGDIARQTRSYLSALKADPKPRPTSRGR
ncbi:MAG: thiamine phosphate synthase [Nitrospirota bacterium]